MADKHTTIVTRFFRAMQTGATAEADMERLFAADAVYLEPFSGRLREHRGRVAILDAMREGWRTPLPNMRIEVDSIRVEGNQVIARWTCYSPVIPGGAGRGENVFELDEAGRIVRLETRLS